ncbi:unnamed protein product [Pedinophyceae sp. YPF-701]|nr:unnamed protein product [Pedinophyceae sp. YPF-701]
MQERLSQYGAAGVIAYGLLNTLYYTCTFLFIWVYVARVPRGLGATQAAIKFTEVLALTWAGSQVTKLARFAGALAMAPVVDILLNKLAQIRVIGSKPKAFAVVVAACLGVAALLFSGVVLCWA